MAQVPLATRMRPGTLEEVVGQRHLIGPGKALTSLVESGHLPSLLLWGPAGSGKTTLAFILGKSMGGEMVQLSAVAHAERGLGGAEVKVTDEALDHLAGIAGGDARIALTGLETAVLTAQGRGDAEVDRALAEESIQKKAIVYDRQGDAHYDVISAFIKSIRGSDPDAALFWLARMLEAGEDPRYVARRMVVHASEDIGLADPRALLVAVAAAQAVEYVGLPEARLNLAEAAIYLATAPKSNSVITALGRATEDAASTDPVPLHLKEASGHPGLRKLGYGKGYKYPHDYPGHRVEQQYLPVRFQGKRYYEPSGQGEEVTPDPAGGEGA